MSCSYQLSGSGHTGHAYGERHSTKVLEVQKTANADDILEGADDFFDGTDRVGGNKAAALCLRWLRSCRWHLADGWVVAVL